MNFGRSRVARDGRRFRCESAASPPQNTKRCIPRASLLGTRPGASEQVPHEQKFPRTLVAPPPIHTHRNTNALREGRLGLPAGVRKQRACRAGGSLCGDAACSRMWYSSAAALVSPAGLGLGVWCVSLLSLGGVQKQPIASSPKNLATGQNIDANAAAREQHSTIPQHESEAYRTIKTIFYLKK